MCVRSERARSRPIHSPNATPHAEIRQNATEYKAEHNRSRYAEYRVPAMRGFVFACVCLCVRGFVRFPWVGASLTPCCAFMYNGNARRCGQVDR